MPSGTIVSVGPPLGPRRRAPGLRHPAGRCCRRSRTTRRRRSCSRPTRCWAAGPCPCRRPRSWDHPAECDHGPEGPEDRVIVTRRDADARGLAVLGDLDVVTGVDDDLVVLDGRDRDATVGALDVHVRDDRRVDGGQLVAIEVDRTVVIARVAGERRVHDRVAVAAEVHGTTGRLGAVLGEGRRDDDRIPLGFERPAVTFRGVVDERRVHDREGLVGVRAAHAPSVVVFPASRDRHVVQRQGEVGLEHATRQLLTDGRTVAFDHHVGVDVDVEPIVVEHVGGARLERDRRAARGVRVLEQDAAASPGLRPRWKDPPVRR